MDAFVAYLEERFNVQSVSGGHQLRVSGACPFCGEDRGDLRLYVNAETGLGQCFHCGTGFNPVKFVMAQEGVGATKALHVLNEGDGYVRHEPDKPDRPTLAAPWPASIPVSESDIAQDYLKGRDIAPLLIDTFGLRYCTANLQVGERLFRTAGRILIPIYDITGKPVSWQARDTSGRAKVKYLFAPGFHAGDHLFNVQAIPRNASYLIICEGVFDAFGWWRAGARNVVATFGKKISEGQVELLRYLKPQAVFMAWDADAPGQKYAFAQEYGRLFPIRLVDLGERDADELPASALKKALTEARAADWHDAILARLSQV